MFELGVKRKRCVTIVFEAIAGGWMILCKEFFCLLADLDFDFEFLAELIPDSHPISGR